MTNTDLAIWSNDQSLAEVKEIFAKDLTEVEFKTFIGIGKTTGLNPFLREIWAVKYGKQSASIFIGRDGYRKSAQANTEYDYHDVDAVYENDDFSVENGVVRHSYNFKNRGKLVGAYCLVKRKNASKAMFTFVDFVEYYLGNKVIKDGKITEEIKVGQYGPMKETLWDTKPATMIKKVAEAQGLRSTFQELFSGTYDESEKWIMDEEKEEKKEIRISENEQKKNFEAFEEKMMCVKNISELQNIFVELNKARKINKDFINKSQLEELIKLKDEIKEKLETPASVEEIQEGEIEKLTEEAETRTGD
ncbi:phage recombination protein Bet [Candidatus Gracilibacteria bacterium HOT-871]|nr:phage recombination protein Bet [Candidatus Gracilibacteria bacterium HOT-871]